MSSQVLGSLSFLDTPDVGGNLVLTTATGMSQGNITGTAGILTVTGTTNIVLTIADNPILPGTAGFTIPVGTTAQREGAPAVGRTRYNSTIGTSETFNGSAWVQDGRILQVVTGVIPSTSNTSGTPPWDGTPPLITEGNQVWSQVFTPMSATSRVIIMQTMTIAHNAVSRVVTSSIFAGATNLGAGGATCAVINTPYALPLTVQHAPGSTAAITYTCRVGANGGNTCFINQTAATAADLGGLATTKYIIMEVA